MHKKLRDLSVRTRLILCLIVGIAAAAIGMRMGHNYTAPLIGWDVAAGLFVGSVLLTVLGFTPEETRQHASRENPGRAAGDVILLFASIASLVAVGLLLSHAASATGRLKVLEIGLGLVSVIVSWLMVHTLYIVTYARLYYEDPVGGVAFNQADQPSYADFAYLAFTLGMTFQVSDTNIERKALRTAILRHALLSYVFGTIIIATTINFMAGLGK